MIELYLPGILLEKAAMLLFVLIAIVTVIPSCEGRRFFVFLSSDSSYQYISFKCSGLSKSLRYIYHLRIGKHGQSGKSLQLNVRLN